MSGFRKKNFFKKDNTERQGDERKGKKRFGRDDSGFRESSRFEKPMNRDFDRSKGEKKFFSAVCDNCGETFDLPFQPRDNKPVYCRGCFKDSGKERFEHSNQAKGNGSRDLEEINRKLDKIMRALKIH